MTLARSIIAVVVGMLAAQALAAQQPRPPAPAIGGTHTLDSLVARALEANPRLAAAERNVEVAQAAVGPAASLDDPMLMAGLMNQPIRGGEEEMTMRALGVSQRLPFPGKLGLQRAAAEHEVDAQRAELEGARRDVIKDVKHAYYELAFLERSGEVVARTRDILGGFLEATQARYGAGTGMQADVLEARGELASVAQDAAAVEQQRRAALARLNELLDRPSDAPVSPSALPERIVRAAAPPDATHVRFVSAALGAPAADSPLPPLAALQDEAARTNPELAARDAMIEAQAARVALAGKAHLPDFDVALQYGQRGGMSDLVSATVSVPVPIHRNDRQDREVAGAEATLASLRAERAAAANELRARVAAAYTEAERARTQLALLAAAVLPPARAAVEAAAASFQVGRTDFPTVLEDQSKLYGYETAYHRALTDFASAVAELERWTGRELLP